MLLIELLDYLMFIINYNFMIPDRTNTYIAYIYINESRFVKSISREFFNFRTFMRLKDPLQTSMHGGAMDDELLVAEFPFVGRRAAALLALVLDRPAAVLQRAARLVGVALARAVLPREVVQSGLRLVQAAGVVVPQLVQLVRLQRELPRLLVRLAVLLTSADEAAVNLLN